jgi:hypothetical protein
MTPEEEEFNEALDEINRMSGPISEEAKFDWEFIRIICHEQHRADFLDDMFFWTIDISQMFRPK